MNRIDPSHAALAEASGAYPRSVRREGELLLWLRPELNSAGDRLVALAPAGHSSLDRLEGKRSDAAGDRRLLDGPLSARNARELRALLPNLTPVPLGLGTSAGFGDRLGVATPGHARAMRSAAAEAGVMPIFAQQSIREMTRTGRTPQEVIDDATWGAIEAGWTGRVGADADHLKTPEDARRCAAAGFSFFTIDPGDRVDDSAEGAAGSELQAKLDALPWDDLETTAADLKRAFVGGRIEAEGLELAFDDETLARAAAKYGAALAHAVAMQRVVRGLGVPFEIEVSVDETDSPTTLTEHVFLVLELRRLGVEFVSLAPRFVGRFEKGVDFRGEMSELASTLDGHARIARAFGPYKLSLHSGSDKFSVYPLIARETRGLVHLKTAGTSYLEALRVAADEEPALFREILELSRDRFEQDRASYHVSAELARVPAAARLEDHELPALLDDDDARQVLHVTFGSALDAFRDRLLALLRREKEAHEATLERHFVRHLRPFAELAATSPR
jgi:hypothetical protein